MKAEWIWLNKDKFANYQNTGFTLDDNNRNFCVADFRKEYLYDKKIKSITINVCADTKFELYLNNSFIGRGPIEQGGDNCFTEHMPKQYYNFYEIQANGTKLLNFYAKVYMGCGVYSDYSCGHGGFILWGNVLFDDGTSDEICTDKNWLVRKNNTYVSHDNSDYTIVSDKWDAPQIINDEIWNIYKSPITNLVEEPVLPIENNFLCIKAHSEKRVTLNFDKIYCGFISCNIFCGGKIEIEMLPLEIDKKNHDKTESIKTDKNITFRSLTMYSLDKIILDIKNNSDIDAEIKNIKLIYSHYPSESIGSFKCSDSGLNKVYSVAKHTLEMCRQSMHYDSPLHQEPLGCTGDYYIESLMEYMLYDNYELVRLDIIRTSDRILMNSGNMFHTTYSLIYFQMVLDYFMFSGDKTILYDTKDALNYLLERFNSFLGDNGILEKSLDYMFMDWMVLDGYSLHHPPKAIGQSVLCAFYYKAILCAIKIFDYMNDEPRKIELENRAKKFKEAFNKNLFDSNRGLWCGGLNTDNFAEESFWLPKNSPKKYFCKHENILGAAYGLCSKDEGKKILSAILKDETLTDYQPYFAHFLFDAFRATDTFEIYGIKELRRWTEMVDECDKGLSEGWFKPEKTYSFDHSHAWGGTPLYQLPSNLLGLKIIEPGFKKTELKPRLYSLDFADIVIPTPLGKIECYMKKGKKPEITIPDGVEAIIS